MVKFLLINIKMLFQRSAVGRGSGNATGELFQSKTERADCCPTMLRYRRPVCKTFPSSPKVLHVGSCVVLLISFKERNDVT